MAKQGNDAETLKLLREIDRKGKRLTPWEIKFVANLIDNDVTQFTPAQAAQVSKIHEERV